MSILSQLNSVPMYLICGGIIAFVAVVCVIFLVRAYCAGQALGMDTTKMKRTIIQCDLFPVAQCGDSVRCHRPVGKSGNALAVASIIRDRCPAL